MLLVFTMIGCGQSATLTSSPNSTISHIKPSQTLLLSTSSSPTSSNTPSPGTAQYQFPSPPRRRGRFPPVRRDQRSSINHNVHR